MGYNAVNEPLLPASSSAGSPDVPPPRYVAVTMADAVPAPARTLDMNNVASIWAHLTSDLRPPTTSISIRGITNANQRNQRTEFRFWVDITPLLVPADPSGPVVKGWRSAVNKFVFSQDRTSPTRRAAIVREHRALLPAGDANFGAINDIVAQLTTPRSDIVGEWARPDDASAREMAPDAVLREVANWEGSGFRWWRTVSLRKRVAWEFTDVTDILTALVRAQKPEWAPGPGSLFSLHIEPATEEQDVTANPLPSKDFRIRVATAAFFVTVFILAQIPGIRPVAFFALLFAVTAFTSSYANMESRMLDARARLSCEYKVGMSVEEFMQRHAAAIVLAAKEGKQNVVLKTNV
ncbi:hypothetical protein HK101_001735 [Irineochytrium annulatum]|nr:hypothetical protein HK101_001735 [Irineochytrium annulatum]